MVNKILHKEEVASNTDTFSYPGGTPGAVVVFSADIPGGRTVGFVDLSGSVQLDEVLSVGDYLYMLEDSMGYTPVQNAVSRKKFTGQGTTFTDLSLYFRVGPFSASGDIFYRKSGGSSPVGPAYYPGEKVHFGASTGFEVYLNAPIKRRDGTYHDVILSLEESGSLHEEYLVGFDYEAVVPEVSIPAEVQLDASLQVDLATFVDNPQDWEITYSLAEGTGTVSGSVLTQDAGSISPVLITFECTSLGWTETHIVPLVFRNTDSHFFADIITGYQKGGNTGNLFLDPAYVDAGSAVQRDPLYYKAPNEQGVDGILLKGPAVAGSTFSIDTPLQEDSGESILSGSILNETLPAQIDELETYKVFLLNLDGTLSELKKIGKYVLNECTDASTPVNLSKLLVVETPGNMDSSLFDSISGGVLELPSWRIPWSTLGELQGVSISSHEKLIFRKMSTFWYYNGASWYTCGEDQLSTRAMPANIVNGAPKEVWQALWEEDADIDVILVNALNGTVALTGQYGEFRVIDGVIEEAPVSTFLGGTIVDRDSIIWESPVFEMTGGVPSWVPSVELYGDDPIELDIATVHKRYSVLSG